MSAITIQQTLLDCGQARMVLASDASQRPMVGVTRGAADDFLQIDRVTMLELERGAVDLRTVFEERCAGLRMNG